MNSYIFCVYLQGNYSHLFRKYSYRLKMSNTRDKRTILDNLFIHIQFLKTIIRDMYSYHYLLRTKYARGLSVYIGNMNCLKFAVHATVSSQERQEWHLFYNSCINCQRGLGVTDRPPSVLAYKYVNHIIYVCTLTHLYYNGFCKLIILGILITDVSNTSSTY